jgi:hypothetical protein
MIAIPGDKRLHIPLPPILKEQVVIVRILVYAPHVKRLIDNKQAEPVARIKHVSRRRIVSAAYRVIADPLAFIYGTRYPGMKQHPKYVVVENTSAFDFKVRR